MPADGMVHDPFAPLSSAAPATSTPAGDWAPILPASRPLPEPIRHRRHGTPNKIWHYRDADGALLFVVCRFDKPDGAKEVLPYTYGTLDGRTGWHWKAPPAPRPLYGLDQLAARPEAPVVVVEGEKTADAAAELFPGHVAMCWQGGAKALGKADWTPLRGRALVAWPDADAAGRKAAAEAVATTIAAGAASAAMVRVPPEWPDAWDVADLGKVDRPQPEGVTLDVLRQLLSQARAEPPPTAPTGIGTAQRSESDDGEERGRQAQRERVIEAVLDTGATFWRDRRGEAHVTIAHAGATQRHRVGSLTFRQLARLLYGRANMAGGRAGSGVVRIGAVGEQALREALGALEAMSLEGDVRDARVRTCFGPDSAVWLDLGCDRWRLVRVAADGWRVVAAADVPVVRPPGLLPLPVPQQQTGALATLRRLLNVDTPQGIDSLRAPDFMLAVAWCVAALHPRGPYPVLALDGEQGSAKSTAARLLRRFVDPNLADVRPVPREEREIAAAAANGRVLAFDNLSHLSSDTADVLCRVATGGGFAERVLYANGEERLTFLQAPVLLNGIPALMARGDLADRAIALTLPAIPDAQRRTEAEVWAEAETAAPGILALLLDGLVLALRDGPGLAMPNPPRMADFARLACAAAPAFGWTAAEMLAALAGNRKQAVAQVIEADAVASAVQAFALDRHERRLGIWIGTARELLEIVNDLTPYERQKERDWPKDPTRLSKALRRVIPALRRSGVRVEDSRKHGIRRIEIECVQPRSGTRSTLSGTADTAGTPDFAGDGAAGAAGAAKSLLSADGVYEGEL